MSQVMEQPQVATSDFAIDNTAHAPAAVPVVEMIAPGEQTDRSKSPEPLVKLEVGLTPGSLASQLCPLGPKDRCTPSQAQAMGQQILSLLATYEKNQLPLPMELQNTFDVFHRCLAVAYSTFFLNLYTKANAPCLLCHGCKSLYPPGQYIHHACPTLPPNIVPCRSRMWRRCLVPLLSTNLDKVQQKQRWKYVLEKFSHNSTGVVRRNPLPPEAECQLLEMPECKRGRFVRYPETNPSQSEQNGNTDAQVNNEPSPPSSLKTLVTGTPSSGNGHLILEMDSPSPKDTDMLSSFMEQLPHSQLFNNQQPSTSSGRTKAVELAGELVQEVRRLERELAVTKARLLVAEEQLSSRLTNDEVRQKLASAVLVQKTLMAEKDHAVHQQTLAQQRSDSLQQQLDHLFSLHTAMKAHFTAGDTM